ncbi:spore cortex biosynthesis protein YabQ [Thalassobacillus devorans]|uniref:spore cortex biosynthesis protein YabQ n=1 Tax=Thalassobacillus devorans TaxID=279813 RepID=UPI00048FF10C|nr:spore cortex biosynthesis protein YabQ [Thalassobacillus devorans]
MTLTTQFLTMAVMIAGGIYLGAAMDTLKRFEKLYRKRMLMNYTIVISFWLLQAFILFFLLYQANYGELRLYIFLSVLCGYAAYRALFQGIYTRILERMIRMIMAMVRFFLRCFEILIVKPIIVIWNVASAIVLWVSSTLLAGSILMLRVLWWPVRLILRLLWKLLPENMKNYLHTLAGFYVTIKNRIINLSKLWKR